MGVSARGRCRIMLLVALSLALCSAARAQETTVVFDPGRTTIQFTVDSTLHLVHGTFRLKSGEIHFDSSTGEARGEIRVDAGSGDTENSGRDKKMHNEILESPKYPDVVFSPTYVKGPMPAQGTSQVDVEGIFRLHGQDHAMTLTFAVERLGNGDVQATTHFAVPYIKWGLKNPSAFVLRVNDTVNVEIHATGHVQIQ